MQIGRFHLSAAPPLLMKPSSRSEVTALTRSIQRLQQSQICVLNYHIDVGASVLGVDSATSATMPEALSISKCPLWPQAGPATTTTHPRIMDSAGERWSVFLYLDSTKVGYICGPLTGPVTVQDTAKKIYTRSEVAESQNSVFQILSCFRRMNPRWKD